MSGDDFGSEIRKVFNSTKNISNKEEKVESNSIEKVVDSEKERLQTLSEKIGEVALSTFIQKSYFIYDVYYFVDKIDQT